MPSLKDTMLDALEKLPGPRRISGDNISILCPFHDETQPSCSIFVGEGMSIPLGTFHCWGCNVSGNWNKLARKLGLPTFKEHQYEESAGIVSASYLAELQEELLGPEDTLENLVAKMGRCQIHTWPRERPWRGYAGSMIQQVGGRALYDMRLKTIMLFFPINIYGKVPGGIKAYLEKPKKGPSYLNTRGKWVEKYGLFPYEYTRRVLKKWKEHYVVLVEGPRDALRLLQLKIPALAILGANNFTEHKAVLVSALDPTKVYVLPDNDQGGDKMAKLVIPILKPHVPVRRVALPASQEKMDPNSAPKKLLLQLREIARKENRG
jgi:5S rRNA maturation endonuclease (ribonuclease M5)